MNASLELLINQAVQKAKLLERALHDRGPWSMVYSDLEVPAKRAILDDGVEFTAEFPDHCYLSLASCGFMGLKVDGTIVSFRACPHPGDRCFTVVWKVTIGVTVVV